MSLTFALSFFFGPAAVAGGLPCEGDRPPVDVWDADGRVTACVAADGRWNGPAEHRRLDGTLHAEGAHRDGQRAGRWRFTAPDGTLLRWGHYDAGHPTGDWFTLDARGEIVATVRWAPLDPDPRPGKAHEDPRISWQADLAGAPRQLEVLGESVLVELAGSLLSVGLDAGARQWRSTLPEALRPGFVVGGRRLGAVTASGELVVVDPEAGQVHRIRTPLGVRDVVSLAGDVAVVREGASRVEALAIGTGRSLWRTRKAYGEVAPVQVGAVAVLARQTSVQARALSDGTSVWTARLRHRVRNLAVSYTGDAVYVLDSAGGLTRLDARTGAAEWRVQAVGPVAARSSVQVRGDSTAVVLKTGQHLVAVSPRGEVLPRVQLPRDAAFEGDRLGSEACFSTRVGTLDCGPVGAPPEDRWRVPLSPLAVAPLLLEDRVLVATGTGALLSVDPRMAQTAGGPLPERSILVDPAVRVQVWPASGEGRGLEATAPLVEQELASADPGCREWQGALDLHALALHSDAPVLSVVAGAQAGVPRPGAIPETLVLDVPDLVLHESSLDAPSAIDLVRWTVLDVHQDATVRYWIDWRPELHTLAATGGDPDVAAAVDRLLRCEGPPARFDGVAVVHDGVLERQVAGRLGVAPLPHRLDGQPGCLVELDVSGEPLGTYGVPSLPGWVEQLWHLDGVTDPDLGLPPVGEAGPPSVVAEDLLVFDGLLPGSAHRTERSWQGPVRLQHTGVEGGDALWVVDAEGAVLDQVAADGMQYGLVGEGPSADTVAVVDWSRTFALEGRHAVDRSQTRFLPVWTATWCGGEAAADRAPPTPSVPPDDANGTDGPDTPRGAGETR